ncbi:hypothetical protein scyTo_0013272, partial [Scyliorhinus torazame]|nr:hypothetical protein [Scyliorhinus torazame]
ERLELPNQFWIPRVLLIFCAEDPVIFSKRIAQAHFLRQKTEALLLYNLYIDCMPVDKLRFLDEESFKRMKKWAFSTPGFRDKSALPNYFNRIEQEVRLEYNRTVNKITFDNMVLSDPKTFSYVTLPDKIEEKVPSKGRIQLPDYPFSRNRKAFSFNTLLTKPEVIVALCKVRAECNKVATMSLFFVTLIKGVRLEEFEQMQSQAHAQIQLFLSDSWINTLKKVLRASLWDVRKGWFNLRESNWEVYRKSKLHMLMEMIRYNLQDSLRYLVQDSLVNYTQMILDGCHSSLNCSSNFKWGEDLLNSNFKPRKMPIFILDLNLDNSGVHFSTALDRFKPVVVALFDKAITATQHVPHIEKFVLEEMFQSGTPLLESVWHNEPPVQELRNTIKMAIGKALIPLKSYAKEYEQFIELNELDIEKYVNAFSNLDPTVHEVKLEVEQHLKKKDQIENTIPSTITIGPFTISVESLRTNLSKKCNNLAQSVLKVFSKKLEVQVEEINDDFKMINRKLFEKPNTIEDLTEHREWMKKIPEMLKANEEVTSKILVDYDIFDEFYYNLSDDDFEAKWSAIAAPHLITARMEAIKAQHMDEEEHFRKIQLSDQSTLQERLEGLEMVVAGFSAYTDMHRAHEIGNEVRRIHKQLVESQHLAQLYNSRERLFELPVTNYERLYKMVKEFHPYRDLWTTTSDWLRWYDSWMNDPLTTIDAEQIEKNVIESYKTLHRCTKFFKDIPGNYSYFN